MGKRINNYQTLITGQICNRRHTYHLTKTQGAQCPILK